MRKRLFFLVATFFFLGAASLAAADTFQYNPEFIGNVLCGGSGSCALPTLLQNLYRYLVVGGLIAAVLFIVLAGLEYILSEIPYVQREAKDKMVQVLIGVLLLLSVGFILGIFGISPVVKIDLPFTVPNALQLVLPKASSTTAGCKFNDPGNPFPPCSCSGVPACAGKSLTAGEYYSIEDCSVYEARPSCCDNYENCGWPERGLCRPDDCGGPPGPNRNNRCGLYLVARACQG